MSDVPSEVQARINRGKKRRDELKSGWAECLEFWRGNQYVYKSGGRLNSLPTTVSASGGKPPHRVRLTRNLLIDAVATEVAFAMSRTPIYEVNPSTTDSEDVGAARLAEKVAVFGHDAWHLRESVERVVTSAVVQDEGFVWPYFDNTVGRPIDNSIAEGDIRLRIYGPEEVYWEPGIKFDDSRWHVIEQEQDRAQVAAMPDYNGEELQGQKDNKNLILVTNYLERPSPAKPKGEWRTIAEGKEITPAKAYPACDAEGNPLDEPCLHKLSYILDPSNDRDMGLVRHALDPQRTYNDALSKASEWKNLCLNPKMMAPIGSIKAAPTDEPGSIDYYIPVAGMKPEWQNPPAIPNELFEMAEKARIEISELFAQGEIPSQVESGKGILAILERDQSRRAAFAARLAEFYSRLMRHCLCLVQRHYTEDRLLLIRGRFGTERIKDFRGAQLRSQVDVTVSPASVEPRTRQAIEQQVLAFADRGWISPEAAMSAIRGGGAEKLIESYELDVSRANRIIQLIREGGADAAMALPNQPDGTPGFMPRKVDNPQVWKAVLSDFMKTEEFDSLPMDSQEIFNLIYDGIVYNEQMQAAQQAELQAQQAESLGMENASKSQKAPPLPDQVKPEE